MPVNWLWYFPRATWADWTHSVYGFWFLCVIYGPCSPSGRHNLSQHISWPSISLCTRPQHFRIAVLLPSAFWHTSLLSQPAKAHAEKDNGTLVRHSSNSTFSALAVTNLLSFCLEVRWHLTTPCIFTWLKWLLQILHYQIKWCYSQHILGLKTLSFRSLSTVTTLHSMITNKFADGKKTQSMGEELPPGSPEHL